MKPEQPQPDPEPSQTPFPFPAEQFPFPALSRRHLAAVLQHQQTTQRRSPALETPADSRPLFASLSCHLPQLRPAPPSCPDASLPTKTKLVVEAQIHEDPVSRVLCSLRRPARHHRCCSVSLPTAVHFV